MQYYKVLKSAEYLSLPLEVVSCCSIQPHVRSHTESCDWFHTLTHLTLKWTDKVSKSICTQSENPIVKQHNF